MEFHEAANIFPLDEGHLDDLAADIRKHGLRVPVETFEGKIIDGRRRSVACQRAGVKITMRQAEIDDPVAYVISLNLHRRHLTPSQLSMCAARARDLYDKQAKERQHQGQKSGGRGHVKNSVGNLPPSSESGKARDAVGKVFGVSGKSVDHATRILENAQPELIKAVDNGQIAVSTAVVYAQDTPEKQREVIQFRADGRRRSPVHECLKRTSTQGQDDEPETEPDPDTDPEARKSRGKGVAMAHQAINLLSQIPLNDGLRKRGFQIVLEWVQRNLKGM